MAHPKNAEEEALQKVRQALAHQHGTAKERRSRVENAWQALRKEATEKGAESKFVDSSIRQRKKKSAKHQKDPDKGGSRKRSRHEMQSKVADPELQSETNEALLNAAKAGDFQTVRGLLTEGRGGLRAHIKARDKNKYTALHWACLHGHLEVVKYLIQFPGGTRLLKEATLTENTPLHFACLGRHADIVKFLDLYKADPYAANQSGQTPISLGLRDLLMVGSEEQRFQAQDSNRAAASSEASAAARWEFDQLHTAPVLADKAEATPAWEAWQAYQAAWEEFARKWKTLGSSTRADVGIRFQDLPWPVEGVRDRKDWKLLLEGLRLPGEELRAAVQKERLKWHPDKFQQMFGQRLSLQDTSEIRAGVDQVCQLLNGLVHEGT